MDKQDLIILLADLDAENTVRALLNDRTRDLNIRPITYETKRHSMRDAGCFNQAHDFVRRYLRTHSHALVIFDRHGCGKEKKTPEEIEADVEERLRKNGWTKDNCACVVLDPELEIWAWTGSDETARILGFDSGAAALTAFLSATDLMKPGQAKPTDPKEAVERCLKENRKPRSARIFSDLAAHVPFQGCEDRSFLKFRRTLEAWFGPL